MSNDKSTVIKHVVVVGGGTAGWLTANHLAKRLAAIGSAAVKVSLVESPDIPTIGVGEGTVPAIRKTLQYLGISETEFIRECDATFKQSIQFVDWVENPKNRTEKDVYHHLFDFPCIQPFDVTPYWLLNSQSRLSYADAVSIQGRICDVGLGPKLMVDAEYAGETQYAYHLDAAKFAQLLTRHAVTNLGVNHHLANVQQVMVSAEGQIEKLVTDMGDIEADFFVDCSGFSALLIGESLGVSFIDKRNMLFADYALAAQVPYADENTAIPCFTISTAKEAGWIWDIGLTQRRGTGYVYSSAHTTHEQAEETLRRYLGSAHADVACRKIPMKVGYREKYWVNNCAAIGLSQGFVEPLEATGLLVYDATARMLADLFPATLEEIPAAATQFNRRVRYAWDRVIDFVKLHYFISRRDDTDFWIDNRSPESVSEELLEKLAVWRYQLPTEYDFPSRMEIFNLENYFYVLYGMKYPTDLAQRASRYSDDARADQIMAQIQRHATSVGQQLLPHRELLNRIKRFGLQKV